MTDKDVDPKPEPEDPKPFKELRFDSEEEYHSFLDLKAQKRTKDAVRAARSEWEAQNETHKNENIEAALTARDKEWEDRIKEREASQARSSEIRLGLVSAGFDPERASELSVLVKEDETPTEAVSRLSEAYGGAAQPPERRGGGQGPGPKGKEDAVGFDPESVKNASETMTTAEFREWYTKNRDKIATARSSRRYGQKEYHLSK